MAPPTLVQKVRHIPLKQAPTDGKGGNKLETPVKPAKPVHGPATQTEPDNSNDSDSEVDAQNVSNILSYASEPVGVYQSLLGWRSRLSKERLSTAITFRVQEISCTVLNDVEVSRDSPAGTVRPRRFVDPTGSQLGGALTAIAEENIPDSIAKLLDEQSGPLPQLLHTVLDRLRVSGNKSQGEGEKKDMAQTAQHPSLFNLLNSRRLKTSPAALSELSIASALHHLALKKPCALDVMFSPQMSSLDRATAAAELYSEKHPAQAAFRSPIGILHMFRQYFLQFGTFLGPRGGHVWISPGGSVELVQVNTRKVFTERTFDESTENITKTEVNQTNKDELSNAIKAENTNDMKLGVSASGSGGVAGVWQASGLAICNLGTSRRQAQETTHKKMREQSSKLASEVRQN
jgi:hypothetical protein